MPPEDTYRHKGLRKQLVNSLRIKGIKDEKVLNAIATVPRHLFLDQEFVEIAYDDRPFPIGQGQTISNPFTVSYQTQLLEIKKGHKILEIGTGSGYQACVLSLLGARVYSIERQKELHEKAKKIITTLNYKNIKLFFGDGFKGLSEYMPYDKVIITAAAPYVPTILLEQLKVSGTMVIPLGKGNIQKMKRLTKTENGVITEDWDDFRFVPMLGGKSY